MIEWRHEPATLGYASTLYCHPIWVACSDKAKQAYQLEGGAKKMPTSPSTGQVGKESSALILFTIAATAVLLIYGRCDSRYMIASLTLHFALTSCRQPADVKVQPGVEDGMGRGSHCKRNLPRMTPRKLPIDLRFDYMDGQHYYQSPLKCLRPNDIRLITDVSITSFV